MALRHNGTLTHRAAGKSWKPLATIAVIAIMVLSAFMFMAQGNANIHSPVGKRGSLHGSAYGSTSSVGNVAYTLDLPNDTLVKGNFYNAAGSPGVFNVMYDRFSNHLWVNDLHSNSLFVVNGTTDTVSSSVSAGYGLIAMSYDPVNHYVYGALGSAGKVEKIGLGGSVTTKIATGKYPSAVLYNPQGKNVFVANSGSNDITVISGKTNSISHTIHVGRNPTSLAYDQNNHMVYAANSYSSNISVINSTTYKVVNSIHVGTFPDGIGVDTSNNIVYVANRNSSSVTVFNGNTGKVTATMAVGIYPAGVAYDPHNNLVYVNDFGSNTTSVIYAKTDSIVSTLNVGYGPQGIQYDPSNHNIYVSNFGSTTLSIIGSHFSFYTVSFNENGLGSGNSWTVNLSDGQKITSSSGTVSFQLSNGSYKYRASTGNSSLVASPGSSSFTVNGSNDNIPLKFVKSGGIGPSQLDAIIATVLVFAAGWAAFAGIMRRRRRKR